MYAVVESGDKQFKVSKNDIFVIEKLGAKKDGEITINKVLLAKDGANVIVGNPYIKGAHIICDVLGPTRLAKVIAYKYKRRKSEKKKIGHRQNVLKVQVKEIVLAK